jgi:hypothetical protein
MLRPNIQQNTSPDTDAWREAKAAELTKQLHRADMRDDWRARAGEITARVLRDLAPEFQEQVLRPRLRKLNDDLTRCWRDRDRETGDFELDRFELSLRLAVEELGRGASAKPQPAEGSATGH